MWYSLPLKSVTAIRLSTCDAGTTFNTQIGVYAGSCSSQGRDPRAQLGAKDRLWQTATPENLQIPTQEKLAGSIYRTNAEIH